MTRHRLLLVLIVHALLLWPLVAAASTETSGDLPWNAPLDKLQENISGPTARALLFIAMAIGGVLWSLADDNRGLFRAGKGLLILAALGTLTSLLGSLGIQGALL
jgi:type IV secretion system protein VirB2